MSVTKEFLEYLNTEVGISPATSQEELDCARSLEGVFSAHGLSPEVQEFKAPTLAGLLHGAVMVLLFVGVLLVGIGNPALTFVGFLLVVAAVVLLALAYTGRDYIVKASPTQHSQNVIGFHPAEGEGASRNRPIVILAHYDTQRVDLLSRPEVAVAKKYLAKYFPYFIGVAGACAFIQILGFIPEGARRTFWVIGVIASLPMLVWGVSLIASRFLPYAAGGVDNKSSLAAMLGVMDRVSPAGNRPVPAPKPATDEQGNEGVHDSVVTPARREPVMREVVEEVIGTRHGEAVIRELGILPDTCDITYIAPEVRLVEVPQPAMEAESESVQAAEVAETVEFEAQPSTEPAEEVDPSDPWATPAAPAHEPPAAEEELGTTSAIEAVSEQAPSEQADPGATQPMVPVSAEPRVDASLEAERAVLSQLEDGQSTDEGPLVENDHSGLYTMAEESDAEAAEAERPVRTAPSKVNDPEWGRSSYKPSPHPTAGNVARRAVLFDLPDPLQADVDPLAPDPVPQQQLSPSPMADTSASAMVTPAPVRIDDAASQHASAYQGSYAADDIQVREAPAAAGDAGKGSKKHGFGGLFGKKRRQQQESMSEWLGVDEDYDAKQSGEAMGSWDNFNDDGMSHHGGGWKGGAALNVNLRGLKDKVAGLAASAAGASGDAASDAAAGEQAAAAEDDSKAAVTSAMDASQVSDAAQAGDEVAKDEAYVPESYDPEAPLPEPSIETISAAKVDRSLRDAILAMADDDLRAHDIWFVATGASGADHAGIKDFVDKNRKKLRGAFVINLECIGAGELTMLTTEGFGNVRKADRRLSNLLGKVADDLHMNVSKLDRPWADTEATPLMRKHLRGVTLMGMGASELPAFARTENDVPENVDPEQVEDVCALVMEAIRRS